MFKIFAFISVFFVALLCSGCQSDQVLTYDQAKYMVIRKSLDNKIIFDIPVVYMEQYRKTNKWNIEPEGFLERIGLSKKQINFSALLPGMDGFSPENEIYFNIPSPGMKVNVFLEFIGISMGNMDVFMKEKGPFVSMPSDPSLPDMPRYINNVDRKVLYVGDLPGSGEKVNITCGYYFDSVLPECQAEVPYRSVYRLRYVFHKKFLRDWEVLNEKVVALLNSFVFSPNNS